MRITTFKIRLNTEFHMQDKRLLNEFLQTHDILQTTSQFVYEKEYFWSILLRYSEKINTVEEPISKKYAANDTQTLNIDEIQILDALKIWRSERAKENSLPPYMVATNSELFSIAKFKPAKKEELLEVKGFGEKKVSKFGQEIIEIVGQF